MTDNNGAVNMNFSIINEKKPNLANLASNYNNFKIDNNSFESSEAITQKTLFLNLSLDNESFVNTLLLRTDGNIAYQSLSLYYSEDGSVWESLKIRKINKDKDAIKIHTVLVWAKYFQIVFLPSKEYKFLKGEISFNSNKTISANSLDRLWVAENLFDKREDYGWSSPHHINKNTEELIFIDLDSSYYINGIRLKSIADERNYFPKSFFIEGSYDNITWSNLLSENGFEVQSRSWYQWKFPVVNLKYIRIRILEGAKIKNNEYVSKILELDILGVPENILLKNSDLEPVYASVLIPGMVKFAENGSPIPGVAVQGDDARLRTATTEYPGILQLAKNGENRGDVAVQGDDARLRTATTEYPGILQLAKNGENRGGVAVQGDDTRLRTATTEYPGSVLLAKDGESVQGKVIQSNDSRLLYANTEQYGIVRFAKPGFKVSDAVVASDDPRLEDRREALPHEHPYAPIVHTLNDHTGTLKIEYTIKNYNERTRDVFSTSSEYPISAVNKEGVSIASLGTVLTNGSTGPGLIAFSEKTTAIEARGTNHSAGSFISENDYAIRLPASVQQLTGSGKALLAEGDIDLSGALNVSKAQNIGIHCARYVDETYENGDLISVNEDGFFQKVSRAQDVIIGVIDKAVGILLNYQSKMNGLKVAISGLVYVKVVGVVRVGNHVGFKGGELGVGQCVDAPGSPLIAMESSSNPSEKLVLCLMR